MTLRAGAAEAVITPPIGTALEGYGARQGASISVHDDLYARAIVVDDGETRAAVAGCDLIGVDRRVVAAARERASAATGIPAAHIMVAATHTHAGPAGLRADLDAGLTDMLARTIAGAIIAAHGQLRPAVLKAGGGSVDSVSQNRRHPDWPADEALHVLLFDTPGPRHGPIASIVNFACHPTVLYHTNLAISADYPGYAVATVKKVLGDAPVVFLNGACGNVNPAWMTQSFDEAERVGSIVGAEAARRLQELRPLGAGQRAWNIRWDELTELPVKSGMLVDPPRIRVASRNVEVPMRDFDPPDAYDRRLADLRRELDALAAGDTDARRRAMEQFTRLGSEREFARRIGRGDGPRRLRPEVQAISLGPGCALLGLPGEFFAETGMRLRQDANLASLLISCYANHHVFYVPPREAFEQGGYEAGSTVLADSAEETVRQASLDLLREVGG
jgi:neutral ceramidase